MSESENIVWMDEAMPAYRQIQLYLEELLAGPDYGPGDRIPSERVLAERLGRNRMTVRKAIDGLVAKGLLERNSTSGTRVPIPRLTRPVDSVSLMQGMRRVIQAGGGTAHSKLLHFEQKRASARVAASLDLEEGAEIVLVRRLWTADETPVCIETTHLPLALVPDLAAQDLMDGGSLYELLHDRYGVEEIYGERKIGVANSTELEGQLLGLEPGTPCLLLELRATDKNGRPIEFTRSVNHPGLVVFRTSRTDMTAGPNA
ncbi:GntR family transcriptional regulator [Acetobacter sp. DsW_063]|uniref:GntR family transcriptional regulator n=1 Tax=Acetobacter sp. DsW_063 TaxID=1514894 RepID=UPI000A3AEBD5|nr:GntR family transcriptional regulator [Acetobacter sp. DsW_063]